MKLPSGVEMVILRIFINQGDKALYGREVVNASDGLLSTRSIYVHLNRLVEKGFLKDEYRDEPKAPETRGKDRRYFKISGEGKEVVRQIDDAGLRNALPAN